MPVPITDKSGRVIAVLVGRPDADGWELVHIEAAEALEDARSKCHFPENSLQGRRGKFPALLDGLSHGNGQTRPTNRTNNATNRQVLDDLQRLSCFKRIAGHASCELSFETCISLRLLNHRQR